jgi:Cu/Ag efflux protein CusF
MDINMSELKDNFKITDSAIMMYLKEEDLVEKKKQSSKVGYMGFKLLGRLNVL